MAADLLGREEMLGRLTGFVDQAWAGERTAVLIAGEAGIGKSSVLRAAAAHASDRGAAVAWGGCSDVVDAPGCPGRKCSERWSARWGRAGPASWQMPMRRC